MVYVDKKNDWFAWQKVEGGIITKSFGGLLNYRINRHKISLEFPLCDGSLMKWP